MTITAATGPGWGTCPVCARRMRLRRDGRLRHHGGPVQATFMGMRRTYCCNGVGRLPTETEARP